MGAETERVRVLLSKSTMDAHDRGIRYIAKKLMDGGIEVIFTRHSLPEEVVHTAVQEDVDVIGLSFSGGGHLTDVEGITNLLKEKGLEIPIVIGGSIPYKDVPKLAAIGVKKYFGPGVDISNIASDFVTLAKERKSQS